METLPYNWAFVRENRLLMDYTHKADYGALIFSLLLAWTNYEQKNFIEKSTHKIFFDDNAFQFVVYKTSYILSRPQKA